MIHLQFWPTLAFVAMIVSWIAFVLAFAWQKKPASSPDRKRDRSSIAGIALQGAGYAILWIVRRAWFTPFWPAGKLGEIALASLTMVLAVASVWFSAAAVRALGK